MGAHVSVTAPARIHLGFYGLKPLKSRSYGGLGLSISEPFYRVEVHKHHKLVVEGCQSQRARYFIERVASAFDIRPRLRVVIKSCIPEHVGLGSTTQLALAVGKAVLLSEDIEVEVYELARVLGRGTISGIGVASFAYGGFIVDAGRGPREAVVKPMIRLEFPEEWRIVLLLPKSGWRVREGVQEEAMLLKMRASDTDYSRALELVFRVIVPSVIESDFDGFVEGVEELQKLVGKSFSSVQYGVYSCSETAAAVEALRRAGGRGVGQSSWGPIAYAFTRCEREALEVFSRIKSMSLPFSVEMLRIVRPRNHGAVIEKLLAP